MHVKPVLGNIPIISLLFMQLLTNCSKKEKAVPTLVQPQPEAITWNVGARCFFDGPSGAFDDIAVKDPSIINSGGRWHLFYTGTNGSAWKIGYASATTIAGLQSSTHNLVSSIGSGGGLAAPQVFYFPVKGKWFLMYQNGTTPSFSTNTDVANVAGWTAARSMGFADGGIDYWCISDGANVYLFYAANDGSHTIKRRSTTVANFPYSWSASTVVTTSTFEAPHVYKNKADGKYYMVVEDMGASRWQELWTATSLGGTWTQVNEQWAYKGNLVYKADHWTDQVSHVELIRSGTDEKLEINNINQCQMLIQGVVDGSYPGYISIPYDLGLIQNY